MSWKLWLAYRFFPVVPPFHFLFVPSFIHLVLFVFSLAALLALFLFPSNKVLQVSVIAIEILSCLLDQNRWQPWEYQYIFIILAMFINYKNEQYAVSVIIFIFVTVYFFSGIGKMNPAFSQNIQHEIARSRIFKESNSYLYNLLIYHMGYFTGVIEILLSMGLLFKRTIKIAAFFLVIMHLAILALFGPFGIDYDRIIWPWNMVMILILYVVFMANPPVSMQVQALKKGWNKLFIVLFGILPLLNFFGYWDFFLSSSLFTYKPPEMFICIHNQGSSKVLKSFFNVNRNHSLCDSNSVLLDVRAWSFKEMQVPAYPEIRVYKSIKEQLLKQYPGMNATFTVYPYINGRKKRIELN
ncbi:MAG: hypothetical protein ABI472_01170 [Ginsengibacter sp.]